MYTQNVEKEKTNKMREVRDKERKMKIVGYVCMYVCVVRLCFWL